MKSLFQFKLNEEKSHNKMLLNESTKLLPDINNLYTKQLQDQFKSCVNIFTNAQKDQLIGNFIDPVIMVFFFDNFVRMMEDDELKVILPSVNDRLNQLLNFFLGGIFIK